MMSSSLPAFAAFAALLATALPASAADASADSTAAVVPVTEALRLGPLPLPLPAFHDSAVKGVTLDDVFGAPSLEPAGLWPRPGDQVRLPAGGSGRLGARVRRSRNLRTDGGRRRAARGVARRQPGRRAMAEGDAARRRGRSREAGRLARRQAHHARRPTARRARENWR